MQHKNSHSPGDQQKRKRSMLPELTEEELVFLKEKRYIDEWDVLRFFKISQSTLYNWIKSGQLFPTRVGGKKFFDLHDIYGRLEEGKAKPKT
ncbi:MAG: DNA-binding protein [Chitinophagaceae bacterium]|nr:MAG: DNA-binding protein [Chitinophagaceae bacterium]